MPTYTVTGPHEVLGHQPGEQFQTDDIPATQEAFLVAVGHLSVTGGLSTKPREELDEMARGLNIDPAAHPNKPSLIDAIQATADPTTTETEE